jgi:hypothetical protein
MARRTPEEKPERKRLGRWDGGEAASRPDGVNTLVPHDGVNNCVFHERRE